MRATDSEEKLLTALFGPSLKGRASETLAEWWMQQVQLFEQLGVEITHIAGKFKQKPKRMSDHTAYTYRRYRRRFEDELSRDNLVWLDLQGMNTKPDGYIAFDWDAECGLNKDDERGVLSETGIDVRYADKLGDNLVEFLVASMLEITRGFVETKYGYCTMMPRSFMPAGYAIGIMASKAPKMFISDANIWSDKIRRECSRYLRNVHAINVLNASHLDLLVGQERLEDWIKARPARGQLTELAEGLMLWSLVDDEADVGSLRWDAPRVQAVRDELMAYDFFPWQ